MSTVMTEFQRSLDDIRQEGQVAVLAQQIGRKFGDRTADEVRRSILESPGRNRIALVATAILDCDTREEFLERVRERGDVESGIGHRDPRPTPRTPGRRQDRPKPWRPGAPQAADAAAGARACRAGAGEPAHPLRDCGRALQGTLGGLRSAGVHRPVSTTRSAGCETTIVCGRYPRNHCCPRDERRTSASAKQGASGSRADSGRMSTICCGVTRNSCPRRRPPDPVRTLSAIDPSGHPGRRATRGGAILPRTRRTHAPEEAGRSGSTRRGIPGSAGRCWRRTTNAAPCASTTSASAYRLLGLEAAHIRWHSHDGRDVVPNGLALCSVHHKALDLGAMGLEGKGGGFRVLVSGRVRGRSPSARRLRGVQGEAAPASKERVGRTGPAVRDLASGGGVSSLRRQEAHAMSIVDSILTTLLDIPTDARGR